MHPVALLGLLPALLAACSTAPPSQLVAPPPLGTADFPGASSLLTGFSERADGPWTSGDEVVFGLRLRKAGDERRWLLRLQVVLGAEIVTIVDDGGDGNRIGVLWGKRAFPYTTGSGDQRRELSVESLMLPVQATVHDEGGTVLGRSTVQLPADLLQSGMLLAVDAVLSGAKDAPGEATPEAMETVVRGLLGLISLLGVVQDDEVLSQYFWQVVEKPSLWSLATNLGVRATLSAQLEQSVPTNGMPPGLPPLGRAYTVPLRVDVNDQPALLVEVTAVAPDRPYSLCGGMVAATAHHPTKPDLHFDLLLLAARCGTPQKVKVRVDGR